MELRAFISDKILKTTRVGRSLKKQATVPNFMVNFSPINVQPPPSLQLTKCYV